MPSERLGFIILLIGIGLVFFQPFYTVTDINNWIAEGMPAKDFADIIDTSRSNRCDLMASNTFRYTGFLVKIECDNNNCNTDPDVLRWKEHGFDLEKTYWKAMIPDFPEDTEFRKPVVAFEEELDYSNFGGGKIYWIGIQPSSGMPNIGDKVCTYRYHIEFGRAPPSPPSPPEDNDTAEPPAPPAPPTQQGYALYLGYALIIIGAYMIRKMF